MSHLQNFNYQLYGQDSKPKLVLLHGLMGYGQNWRTIARAFENDFQVLAYDQRGHGKSFQPAEGYSPADYADDLNKIITELGWNKIILVGHSMGGRNAMHFASLYPHKLVALVIEDIGPESSIESIQSLEQIIASVATPYSSKAEAKADLMAKHSPTLANFLLSSLEETEGVVDWRLSKRGVLLSLYQGREKNHWNEWQSITTPTLVIRGEHSKDLSVTTYNEMLRKNPRAQGIEIPAAGHWVHFEQPQAVINSIKDFLRALGLL